MHHLHGWELQGAGIEPATHRAIFAHHGLLVADCSAAELPSTGLVRPNTPVPMRLSAASDWQS